MIRYRTAAIALAATVGFSTIVAGQGRPDPATGAVIIAMKAA